MGKRTGLPRGRPKGSQNKATSERTERARANGLLPHEFLLAVAQGQTFDNHEPTFAERMTAAAQAAPYYAPRLSNVEAKVSHDFAKLTEAELDATIASYQAIAETAH